MNKIKIHLTHEDATVISNMLHDMTMAEAKKDLQAIQHSSLCMELYIGLLKKTFIKYNGEKKYTLTIAQSIALFLELGKWANDWPSVYAMAMSLRETIFKQLNNITHG
jgi:hypothetical protein